MSKLKKIIGLVKQRQKAVDEEDAMAVPRIIEPILNQAAFDVVAIYRERLLKEPATYVVPAIWGTKEDGEIDALQTEIYEGVLPLIEQAHEAIGMDDLSAAQRFSMAYLVKGLIIAKIMYMLEILRHRLDSDMQLREGEACGLAFVEPVGRA